MNKITQKEGRLPNLLIIGAMKAGTTSLHHYLNLHPDIFMSSPKEIHYFIEENYQKHDINWYKSFFKSQKKIVGTAPQNYTKRHNNAYMGIPERIYAHIPEVKMIYILRDPIERYKSHILENYYGGPWHRNYFEEEEENHLKTSLYHYQLEAYLQYFHLDQIFITTLEELKKDKLKVLNQIFSFLEVSTLDDEEQFNFISNTRTQKILPHVFKRRLLYRGIKKVWPFLAEEMNKSELLKRYFFQQEKVLKKAEEQLESVIPLFIEDTKKLRALTGKEFELWSV
jgi:hypothetical protein